MNNREFFGRIRDMWRMYQLLCRLRKYPYRKGAGQGEKYTFQRQGTEENKFIFHLQSRGFLKNWRQALHEIPMQFGYNIKVSEKGVARIQKRNHVIDLIIQSCREKGYLEMTSVAPKRLMLTGKGYRFSGAWKIGFISECLGENGLFQLIISAIIGGIIGSVITKLL